MENQSTCTSSKQPVYPETFSYRTASDAATKREYQNRSIGNLLRMGHCAPTVMQTVLDAAHIEQEWLVKLTAAMPGGIGNTGFECGGFTSSLLLMGLRYGLGGADHELPLIFHKGYGLCERFLNCNKTLLCQEIRGKDRLPLRCIPVIRHSPELLAQATADDSLPIIPEAKREAYHRLYTHLAQKGFHCAQAVFQNLGDTLPVDQTLLNAAAGFLGGTLFQGRTCSAFTAGIMAIGLKSGEIEDSPLRVMRMIAMMAFGGNAFDDSVNKFNGPMNTGYRLSKWFRKEFGSTQCREITQCDFSCAQGVSKYIESNWAARCKVIAEMVALQVQAILKKQN